MTQKIGFDPDGAYRGSTTNTAYVIPLFVNLADITAADIMQTYTLGHRFALVGFDFRVFKAVTTASKAATISLKIGSTAVTGGSIALTSANCTPTGTAVAGSSITAANTGSSTDTISITAASVTAFAEGSGWLLLKVQNLD